MKKQSIDEVDIFIGQQIRTARLLRGISLKNLGQKLDLSYQQVQKYEKGTNRTSASMLRQIAIILNMPIQFFFDDAFSGIHFDSAKYSLIALQLASVKDPEIRQKLEELILLNAEV